MFAVKRAGGDGKVICGESDLAMAGFEQSKTINTRTYLNNIIPVNTRR